MSIEVATFIGDLQPANPPGTDPRGQGDDHIRLMKQVLQNSFPGLEKAIYFPTTTAKSANFSILATDMSNEFLVSTPGGAITATLPNGLVAGDAGWKCYFRKITTDVNPLFIAPASGTLTSGYITGLASARRCIPGAKIEALWVGTGWIISRALNAPVGSMLDFNSATLPPGFEWPNGQSLSSGANYPEYNSANGALTTLDLRGRQTLTLDNLGGSAAGRLAGGVITGTAVGNVGGLDTTTQLRSDLVNVAPTFSGSAGTATSTNTGIVVNGFPIGPGSSGGGAAPVGGSITGNLLSSFTPQGTISSINGNVAQTAMKTLDPSIMCAKILIVE